MSAVRINTLSSCFSIAFCFLFFCPNIITHYLVFQYKVCINIKLVKGCSVRISGAIG